MIITMLGHLGGILMMLKDISVRFYLVQAKQLLQYYLYLRKTVVSDTLRYLIDTDLFETGLDIGKIVDTMKMEYDEFYENIDKVSAVLQGTDFKRNRFIEMRIFYESD